MYKPKELGVLIKLGRSADIIGCGCRPNSKPPNAAH